MTYGALIEQTIARLRADNESKDLRDVESSLRKFVRLSGQQLDAEVDPALMSDAGIKRMRAAAETAGTLKRGGSAAWASRVKHLVRTWDVHQSRAANATFATLLRDGCKAARQSPWAVAKIVGLPEGTFYGWMTGAALPSVAKMPEVRKLSAHLKLGQQLEASLEGFKLRDRPKFQCNEIEAADAKAGKKTLHFTIRYFLSISNVSLKKAAIQAGLRSTFLTYYAAISEEPKQPRPTLREGDTASFEKLDKALSAGGIVVRVFKKEMGAQGPIGEMLSFPARKWSERLKNEFQRLVDYKGRNPEMLERTRRGKWSTAVLPNGQKHKPSEKGIRGQIGEVLGYALRAKIVANPEALRLAHFIVPQILIGYITERMERTGRTFLHAGDQRLLGHVGSLIMGGEEGSRGYFANDKIGAAFCDDPFFAVQLPVDWLPVAPGGYRIQTERIPIPEIAGRWQAYLAEVSKTIRRFQMDSDVGYAGKYFACIKDVLENPDFDVRAWLAEGFERLAGSVPPRKSAPMAWARHIRGCVAYLFMCTRGFRRTTQVRLETKHVVWNESADAYYYDIQEALLKSRGRGGSKGGVRAKVDDVMAAVLAELDRDDKPSLLPTTATTLLHLYIREARPLLQIQSNSFFGWNNANGFGAAFVGITELALGRNVTPHAFRYLIATWCKRMGIQVEDAATVLGNLPQTAQRIYDQTNAIDRGREANATVRKMWSPSNAA